MKKFVLLLFAVMVSFVNAFADEASDGLYVRSTPLRCGEVNDVTVAMRNGAAVSGLQFDVVLPDGVSLVTDDAHGYAVDIVAERTTAESHKVYCRRLADGSVRIICTSLTGGTFAAGDGDVLTISVMVDDDAVLGAAAITLKAAELSLPDNTTIALGDVAATVEVVPTKVSITATTADEALGSVTGSGIYGVGAEVTLTATAAEGYEFVGWSDGTTANPYTFTATADKSLTAEFAIIRLTISATADEAMGSVTGAGTYDYGTEVTLTATAAEGYEFVGWSDGTTANPYTFTATADKSLTAEFAIIRLTISATADEALGSVTGAGTYDYGTEVTLTATAAEGYIFWTWTDGVTDNPRTLTATTDASYEAVFVPQHIVVTATSADEAQGSVAGAGTYDYGTEVTLTATAAEGYEFARWSDGTVLNPYTFTATEDKSVTAEFAPYGTVSNLYVAEAPLQRGRENVLTISMRNNVAVTGLQFDLHLPEGMRVATDDAGKSIVEVATERTTATAHKVFCREQSDGSLRIICSSFAGATFSGDDGAVVLVHVIIDADHATGLSEISLTGVELSLPDNTTVLAPAAQTEIEVVPAVFVITVTSNDETIGSVTGGGEYAEGATVTLTATAEEGFDFKEWSDGTVDNPYTFTATADVTLTAEFGTRGMTYDDWTSTNTGHSTTSSHTYSIPYKKGDSLEFDWMVSSESGYDFFTVTLDGTEILKKSGNDSGHYTKTFTTNGTVTLVAKYAKDNSQSSGSDQGKIYNVKLMAASPVTITALSADESQGTVTGGRCVANGTQVTLTATAAEGYEFVRWSDGTTANPYTFTATDDKTLTAEFTVKVVYITVDTGGSHLGEVTGSTVCDYGTEVTLTATPITNYRFAGWSDGSTENPRTFTATDDLSVTAAFEPIPWGDFNQDGEITISDVTELVDYILTHE